MFESFSIESALNLGIQLVLAVLLGLILRQCFRILLHSWASTFSSIWVFGLLPATTFAVTNIISDNVALSLGMVGALSIIRFRNPVRSPAELVAYFLLITTGICLTQDIKVSIMLVALVLVFAIFLKLIRTANTRASFTFMGSDESALYYSLVAEASQKLTSPEIESNSQFLSFQKVTQASGQYEYHWEFPSRNQCEDLLKELEELGQHQKIDYSVSKLNR